MYWLEYYFACAAHSAGGRGGKRHRLRQVCLAARARTRIVRKCQEDHDRHRGEACSNSRARAMLVKLQAGDKVSFALLPERKPRSEHWFGGAISFGSVSRMGIYQVTLSEDAWIDVVQDNQFVRSVEAQDGATAPGCVKAFAWSSVQPRSSCKSVGSNRRRSW
jgi:hypothetical protein